MPASNSATMLRASLFMKRYVESGLKYFVGRAVHNTMNGSGIAPGIPTDTTATRASGRLSVSGGLAGAIDIRGRDSKGRFTGGGKLKFLNQDDVNQVFASYELGQELELVFLSPVAAILDEGRTTDKRGRPIGSHQAPDGFMQQAIDQSKIDTDGWVYEGD